MKKTTIGTLVGLLVLGLLGHAWASTACMRFLDITTYPRIAALGQAGVGLGDSPWAAINPAHVLNTKGSLISFSHTSWFSDISLEALSLSTASGKHGFGLGVVGLHTEPLEKYDEFDTYEGSFRFFDVAVSASYARRLGGGLGIGGTGKVVYEKIDWDGATGFAADLGLIYESPEGFLGGKVGLGIAARNLGTKIGYHGEKFDLPSGFQAGMAYRAGWLPPYASLSVAVDYQSTRLGENGLLAGLEVDLARVVALRLGFRDAYESEVTFGVGIRLATVSIDYAYMELANDLGGTHRFAINFATGPIFPSPEESR